MALFVRLPVGVRRLAYRLAYAFLSVYWFLRRPVCHGVKCVLTDGDRVLLVLHTYGQKVWDLPGGSIKSREEAITAARREMHEELGLAIDDWTSLGELEGRQRHRRDTLHLFHAELPNPHLTIDLGEIASAHWFNRDEIPADTGRYVRPILDRLEPAPRLH